MGKPRFGLFAMARCLLLLIILDRVEPSLARPSHAKAFIEASCRTTSYPKLCRHTLSGFANSQSTIDSPQHLAQLALSVSLYRARYTRSYLVQVAKVFEAVKSTDYPAVKDCLVQINDGVDQLSQSMKELRRLDRLRDKTGTIISDEFLFSISNIETWASTALTDANACAEQFPGRRMSKLKATIKGKVLNVAQVTSNALALFDKYAIKYRAAAAAKKVP